MDSQYNQYNLEAEFKKSLVAENVSLNTVKNYLSDLRHFLGWLQSNQSGIIPLSHVIPTEVEAIVLSERRRSLSSRDSSTPPPSGGSARNDTHMLENINSDIVTHYKTYLLSNNLPLKTVNRRLSTLRKFFSFCISQGWMKENPAKKVVNITPPKTSVIPSGPSESEGNVEESSEAKKKRPDKIGTRSFANAQDDIKLFKNYLKSSDLEEDLISVTLTDVKEFLEFANIPSL